MSSRMTFFAFTLVVLGLSIYFTEAVAEQRLGRLFYTPDQRGEMERRTTNDQANNSPALHYDGHIRRSDGKTVNWVNGSFENRPAETQSLLQGRLKVGQSVETQTGEVHDRLKGGRIVVREKP